MTPQITALRSPGVLRVTTRANSPDGTSPGTPTWVFPSGLVLLVMFVYSPVLWFDYGFSDDYALLMQQQTNPGATSDFLVGAGRPVTALLDRLALGLTNDIQGLAGLRLVTVVGLALVALALYACFTRCLPLPGWQAASLAGAIVVLPPFQVSATWAILFVVPIGVLAAVAAAALVVQPTRGLKVSRLAAATGLLSVSMLIYQPAAMFFTVLVGAVALHDLHEQSVRETLRRIVPAALVAIVSTSIGLVALVVGLRVTGVGGERAGTTRDPGAKLEWFVTAVLPRAADPLAASSISTRFWPGLIVGLVTTIGLFFWFSGNTGQRLGKLALASLLLPAAYAPNLVLLEDWPSTRSRLALMPVLMVLLFFAVRGLVPSQVQVNRLVGPALALTTVASLSLSGQTDLAVTFAVPQAQELGAARSAVTAAVDSGALDDGVLTVAKSNWFDSLAPRLAFDEYGVPSTAQPHVPVPLVQLILRERGLQWDGVRLAVDGETAEIDFAGVLAAAEAYSPADFTPSVRVDVGSESAGLTGPPTGVSGSK